MRHSGRIFWVLVAVLVAVLIAGLYRRSARNRHNDALAFTVTTQHGKTISSAAFGGKLLVLNFWASWCEPCIAETSSLKAFQQDFAGQGVVVLGVSVDRDPKQYAAFLERLQVGYETWLDPEAEGGLATRYGTFSIPETYILNQAGHVVLKIPGPVDFKDPEFVATVQKML